MGAIILNLYIFLFENMVCLNFVKNNEHHEVINELKKIVLDVETKRFNLEF